MLALYRDLLHARRESPALNRGSLELITDLPTGVLGYRRTDGESGQQYAVFANLGEATATVRAVSSRAVITCGGALAEDGTITLPADAAIVVTRERPAVAADS